LTEEIHFFSILIELSVGLSNEVFHSSPIAISHSFIGHDKPSIIVLRKNQVGGRIDYLSQEPMGSAKLSFRPFAF
jgi:hypothetical protein